MTDPAYRPKNLKDALYRLSEECHELGKVACKAGRFGLDDIHPKKGVSNHVLIQREFEDVKDALADVIRFYVPESKAHTEGTRPWAKARRFSKAQKSWLKKYEVESGYEPMYTDDFAYGDLEFDELMSRNMRWLEAHHWQIQENINNSPTPRN